MKHLKPRIKNPLVRRLLAHNLVMIHRVTLSLAETRFYHHDARYEARSIARWMLWSSGELAGEMQWQLPAVLCKSTKWMGDDRMACSLPYRHYGDCRYDRFEPISLEPGNIPEDVIVHIAKTLNDGESSTYSNDKIRDAIWRTLVDIVDETQEDLEYFVMKHENWEHHLGEPEVDRTEEQRLEAGDLAFDRAIGK